MNYYLDEKHTTKKLLIRKITVIGFIIIIYLLVFHSLLLIIAFFLNKREKNEINHKYLKIHRTFCKTKFSQTVIEYN